MKALSIITIVLVIIGIALDVLVVIGVANIMSMAKSLGL